MFYLQLICDPFYGVISNSTSIGDLTTINDYDENHDLDESLEEEVGTYFC